MNPLIHNAFRIMADKLLIMYKNKYEKQKKDLDGFHYAQKLNKIYLPSYYNTDNCVICNTCIKNNSEKYKDMVWKSNIDYLSNTNPPSYPDGLDAEVFSFNCLSLANKEARDRYDREHVTTFIKENNKFKKCIIKTFIFPSLRSLPGNPLSLIPRKSDRSS